MSRGTNPPIGTVPCPYRGCEHIAAVHKMAERSPDVPGRRRHGGKLYGRCPVHGQFADQEYILGAATIGREAAPVDPSPRDPAPRNPSAGLVPGRGWGFF